MSISLMALVWTSTMTDATQVDVLSKLANHANGDGDSCFAGIPRIAKLVRRSERTVQRTIDALERDGWLTVIRGDGAGNLTQYRINVEMLKGCQDVTLLPKPKRVTSEPKRVTLATEKGDIGDSSLIGRNVSKLKANRNTPLPPEDGGSADPGPGCAVNRPALPESIERSRGIELAADAVMAGCGFTRRRLRWTLRAQIELSCDQGELAPAVALAMIEAWKRQMLEHDAGNLRAQYGAEKFFGDRIWANEQLWHWDGEALERKRNARTASWTPAPVDTRTLGEIMGAEWCERARTAENPNDLQRRYLCEEKRMESG